MKVLVFNAGSSSLKCSLIDAACDARLWHGRVEGIGRQGTTYRSQLQGDDPHDSTCVMPDIAAAFRLVTGTLVELQSAGLLPRIDAVAHRVVHGGARFREPTQVDGQVLAELAAVQDLAPLHNGPALGLIEAAMQCFADVPQVLHFDTAFHATLPEYAWRYAVPGDWYRDHGVRRYGFHGISHGFVSRRAEAMLELTSEPLKVISLHLGHGASATAILNGCSVDTSMGMTPLEGLVMGTRSGDMDPAILPYMSQRTGATPAQLNHSLTRESGLLGLCGETDLRRIVQRVEAGDAEAELAMEVYVHRLRKYIGAYAAVLGGVDALVFTGGVGENAVAIRQRVCAGLGYLGIQLDAGRNAEVCGRDGAIQQAGSRVAVLVICTDEETEMARMTLQALAGQAATHND